MLYQHNTSKLLGLKDVIEKNISETEDSINVNVEVKRHKHRCPTCGCETDNIHD